MTFDEARAQFPVLERIAYLNAGTFGPIAGATYDAMQRRARARRRSRPQRSAALRARDGAAGGGAHAPRVARLRRPATGRRSRRAPRTGATSSSPASASASGRRDRDDDRRALRPARPTATPRARRVVVVDPEPEAIRAAVTPRTRLLALSAGALDDGSCPARAGAARGHGRPRPRRRRPVGGRDSGRRRGSRLPHDLGPEVAVRPGLDRGAGRRRPRSLARGGAELLLPGRVRARWGLRAPARSRTLRRGLVAGLVARRPARGDRQPARLGFDHAASVADRCRELLAERVEVVVPEPSARRSSPSMRRAPRGRRCRGHRRSRSTPPASTCARSREPD